MGTDPVGQHSMYALTRRGGLGRFFLAGLACLAWSARARALSLSDIETQIRLNVRDNPSSSAQQRYTDTTLDLLINDAQREVVNFTWCLEKVTTQALASGTTYYDLPTDMLAVKQVTYVSSTGERSELVEWSEKKVIDQEPDYERSSTGEPNHYFVRITTSTTGIKPQIVFLPIPTSSFGTAYIQYFVVASDLETDAAVPFLGLTTLYSYHNLLVYRVTARIKAMEGKFSQADFYQKLFETGVLNMRDRIGARPNYNPSLQGAPR